MSAIVDVARKLTLDCVSCPLIGTTKCDSGKCLDLVADWLDERLVERKAGE